MKSLRNTVDEVAYMLGIKTRMTLREALARGPQALGLTALGLALSLPPMRWCVLNLTAMFFSLWVHRFTSTQPWASKPLTTL